MRQDFNQTASVAKKRLLIEVMGKMLFLLLTSGTFAYSLLRFISPE